MADSDTEITKEELQKEIAGILNKASLDNTSTKKVIQKLEQKLGVDLSEKKKLIDQLVMDYVNSIDSEGEESEPEEEPPKKKPAVRKAKKQDDDDDDEEHDDSNDSDWGYHHHEGHLLDGYSDENYHLLPQESTITTSGMRHLPNRAQKAVILKRVTPNDEDEADIFGKLTAKKLRKLSDEQRDLMMIQINQLFYDKCHKRATPPKRKMVDKSTGMLPVIECDAKKIFRIDGAPKNLTAPPIPIARANFPNPFGTSTNVSMTVVAPSNVPEPFVQEATTPKPPNNASTGYRCGLM